MFRSFSFAVSGVEDEPKSPDTWQQNNRFLEGFRFFLVGKLFNSLFSTLFFVTLSLVDKRAGFTVAGSQRQGPFMLPFFWLVIPGMWKPGTMALAVSHKSGPSWQDNHVSHPSNAIKRICDLSTSSKDRVKTSL